MSRLAPPRTGPCHICGVTRELRYRCDACRNMLCGVDTEMPAAGRHLCTLCHAEEGAA